MNGIRSIKENVVGFLPTGQRLSKTKDFQMKLIPIGFDESMEEMVAGKKTQRSHPRDRIRSREQETIESW